jgi:hypothetical protein
MEGLASVPNWLRQREAEEEGMQKAFRSRTPWTQAWRERERMNAKTEEKSSGLFNRPIHEGPSFGISLASQPAERILSEQ